MLLNAVLSHLYYPIHLVVGYLRFLLGLLLSLPFLFTKDILRHDKLFAIVKNIPFGKHFFSGLIGIFAPYTASISPFVVELTKEQCIVEVDDLYWHRNPFNSVHAIVLSNLGELCSGLPMVVTLQYNKDVKAIPVEISTVYHSKARGRLRGIGKVEKFTKNMDQIVVTTEVYDSLNKLVSVTSATWKVTKSKSA